MKRSTLQKRVNLYQKSFIGLAPRSNPINKLAVNLINNLCALGKIVYSSETI
jgi:hypothetical protein